MKKVVIVMSDRESLEDELLETLEELEEAGKNIIFGGEVNKKACVPFPESVSPSQSKYSIPEMADICDILADSEESDPMSLEAPANWPPAEGKEIPDELLRELEDAGGGEEMNMEEFQNFMLMFGGNPTGQIVYN
ncbi:MAG: hypothetical protein GY765_07375 [bacterium]|nr:hypothetical protein [bacterium]